MDVPFTSTLTFHPSIPAAFDSALFRVFWPLVLEEPYCIAHSAKRMHLLQFSCSVMSDSVSPQIAACQASLSITNSTVYSNTCPLRQWCHPTISSSVVPFSSCLKPFPASESFPMSQFFASGGQSIGISASASVLPINSQDWFPLGWTGWISLQSKGLSRVFSNTTVQKHQFFGAQLSLESNSHIHTWLLEKNITLPGQTFVGKVTSQLSNMLSKLVITFFPSSRCLLILWLQLPSAVILEPPKIKYLTVSIFFPIYLPWSDGTRCHDPSLLNVEF